MNIRPLLQQNATVSKDITQEMVSEIDPAQRTSVTLPTAPRISTAGTKMII